MPPSSTALVHLAGDVVLAAEPAAETARAADYAMQARAPKTRSTYAGELRLFTAWCDERGLVPLPALDNTVAAYLAHLADAGRKAAGIEVALTAISQAHKHAGLPSPRSSPAVAETRKGIRRTLGVAQQGKAPLLAGALCAILDKLPDTLMGKRDRALLLLGWTGAFRRGEHVAFDVDDIRIEPEGLHITIRRSKTDQQGAGHVLGIPRGRTPATCPVVALRAWLDASGRRSGAVFVGMTRWGTTTGKRLAGGDVARIVKRSAKAAGIDPRELSAHSLRRGFATQAARAKKERKTIQAHLRHGSSAMTDRYIEAAGMFEDNPADGLL